MQAFTYFPYSAPITALLRNAFGNRPLRQAGVVIAELFALTVVVLQVVARIFQTGSIASTNRVHLRTVFNRLRKTSRASSEPSVETNPVR